MSSNRKRKNQFYKESTKTDIRQEEQKQIFGESVASIQSDQEDYLEKHQEDAQ